MSKLNLILYGRRNTGKTTALVELVKLLVGNPAVSAAIDAALKLPSGRYHDAKFIVEMNGHIILVGTAGDSWELCRGNIDLFEGTYSGGTDIYLVTAASFSLMDTQQKTTYKSRVDQACVCVTACSPVNLKKGAIKALHAYSETALMGYSRQIWVRTDDKIHSTATANELFDIIKDFIKK